MSTTDLVLNALASHLPTIVLLSFAYAMLCLTITPAVWFGQRLAAKETETATVWDAVACVFAFTVFVALDVQEMLNIKMLVIDKTWIYWGLNGQHVFLAFFAAWLSTCAIVGMSAGAVFAERRHQIVGFGTALVPLSVFGYFAV